MADPDACVCEIVLGVHRGDYTVKELGTFSTWCPRCNHVLRFKLSSDYGVAPAVKSLSSPIAIKND